MKNSLKSIIVLLTVIFIISAISVTAFATEDPAKTSAENTSESFQVEEDEITASTTNTKAIASAIIIAVIASAGAIAMAVAIKSASDGMSRQPEASDGIRSSTMLGLVFIETAIIYGLIVAILIIFVL